MKSSKIFNCMLRRRSWLFLSSVWYRFNRQFTRYFFLYFYFVKSMETSVSFAQLNLMDVLEAGIKYATETNNKTLSNQINQVGDCLSIPSGLP